MRQQQSCVDANMVTSSVLWVIVFLLLVRPFESTRGSGDPTVTFWQVTDLHWDKRYSRTGDPLDLCHGLNVSLDNGFYGNASCDTSWPLVTSAIMAMQQLQPEPDFVLWSGDNAPHIEYPEQTWSDVFESLSTTTALLRRHFPTTPVLPVLGNHDTVPTWQFPPDDPQFYGLFLSNGSWNELLPEDGDVRETFLKGGYYSTGTDVRVVVLNTCLYVRQNRMVNETTERDPGGQFSWLERQLQETRENGTKVIIASHVALGYFATSAQWQHLKATYNDRLVRLIAGNADVIAALVFGHEHVDAFRLIPDDQGNFVVGAFIAPPVNPWTPESVDPVNPGIRLYEYDDGEVLDYTQYYLDYGEANVNVSTGRSCQWSSSSACVCDEEGNVPCAEWRLLYRPTQAYNLSDLSVASLTLLHAKVRDSPGSFDTFFRHLHLDYAPAAECDASCHRTVLCSIGSVTRDAMRRCLDAEENNHKYSFTF